MRSQDREVHRVMRHLATGHFKAKARILGAAHLELPCRIDVSIVAPNKNITRCAAGTKTSGIQDVLINLRLGAFCIGQSTTSSQVYRANKRCASLSK